MSARSIKTKQANRLRKALRGSPGTLIDLIEYVKVRRLADTTGAAEKLILDGRVTVDKNPIGIVPGKKVKQGSVPKARLGRELTEDDYEQVDTVQRFVPADLRNRIQIQAYA